MRTPRRAATRGKEAALLLLVAEEDERLRHANGLMRGEQRGEIAAETSEQHRRAAVVRLRKPEPAELLRNLDAKCAELREVVEDALRDLAGAIDLVGIDVLFEKCFERLEEFIAEFAIRDALQRQRVERGEIAAAHEEPADETLARHVARGLGHFQCLALLARHLRRVDGGPRFFGERVSLHSG